MKINYFLFVLTTLVLTFSSCRKDDGIDEGIPERDRTEQQAVDKDSLLTYLSSHYYNSGDFTFDMEGNDINASIDNLEITELMEGESVPAEHTLLSEVIETYTTNFLDVEYEYYVLKLNQGGGEEKPHFSDDVRVNYDGNTLDGEIFDNTVSPIDFDLLQLVPGWGKVLPKFNVSESNTVNSDNTVSYFNSGVGVMFLPSGLAFYSASAPGVPLYSNVLFKFELYQTEVNDHDGDNIPSFMEDINNDGQLNNDDTDDNGINDFIDVDDDGDFVLTINEDLEPDEDLTVDRDGDGDSTNDIGDGDPTNDDSDDDGIPNYLDDDDTCSKLDYESDDGIVDCEDDTN